MLMASVLMLAAGAFIIASDSQDNDASPSMIGDDLYWEITGGTLKIWGTGDMWEYTGLITYPWYVNNLYKVKHIELGEGITSLGKECFGHFPYLTGEIVIPSSLEKIGASAFTTTGITKLVFAEDSKLKTIGDYAFQGCTSMTEFSIPAGVEKIGYCAFQDCTSLTGTLAIPKGIKSLGWFAFQNCSKMQGSVEIPSGISLFGTFDGCSSLTGELRIGEYMQIGSDTFRGCSGLTGTPTFTGQFSMGVQPRAFEGCSGLTGDIILPDNIFAMVQEAGFKDCTGITSVKILQGYGLEDYAFAGCTGLTKVTLGKDIQNLAPTAFDGIKFFDEEGKELVLSEETVDQFKGYVFEGKDGELKRISQTDEDIPDKPEEPTKETNVWMIATPVAFILGVLLTLLIVHFRRP